MSARIYQQVNLYEPIFRRRRQLLSAVTMLQSAAVAVIALMTIYFYGLWQLQRLEAQVVEIEGRERAYSAQIAGFDPGVSGQERARVEQDIEALDATLLAQQRLLEVLRERPAGAASGFSQALAALDRQTVPGLSLTELRINGMTNSIELAGRSTDPVMVPEYLLRLGDESALAGQRFDRFEIERRGDGPAVTFHVSSQAVAQ